MNRRPRGFLALLPVAMLTLVLTLLLSGGEGARALFQDSPISPLPTDSPLDTPTPSELTSPPPTVIVQPTARPTAIPLATIQRPTTSARPGLPAGTVLVRPTLQSPATFAPPTVPLPPTVGPTPTVRGFLPAPTIVNPNDLQSLPLAQPPASGGDPSTEPAVATSSPLSADPTARAAVRLLNYLWLLCGGALLIGGAATIFVIWRRGQHT